MTHVNLLFLAGVKIGGWPTYTVHLAKGLREAGHEVTLWCPGTKTEEKDRPFGRGISYRLASIEMMKELAKKEVTHITAVTATSATLIAELLRAGASLTIHDPTELKGMMATALRKTRKPIVVIRPIMGTQFQSHKLPYRLVRHPYLRAPMPEVAPERDVHAVAFSRIDWDKGSEYIVQANKELPPELNVQMWGQENRLYAYHKLATADPDWKRNYRGKWETKNLWEPVEIARRARYALDMSSIKGDGGGTQYTFLEALDGGAALILNKKWLTAEDSFNEMAPYATFIDPVDLADTLRTGVEKKNAEELFGHHDAKTRALETVGLA